MKEDSSHSGGSTIGACSWYFLEITWLFEDECGVCLLRDHLTVGPGYLGGGEDAG